MTEGRLGFQKVTERLRTAHVVAKGLCKHETGMARLELSGSVQAPALAAEGVSLKQSDNAQAERNRAHMPRAKPALPALGSFFLLFFFFFFFPVPVPSPLVAAEA